MDQKLNFWQPGGTIFILVMPDSSRAFNSMTFHVCSISLAIMDQKLTKWSPGTVQYITGKHST